MEIFKRHYAPRVSVLSEWASRPMISVKCDFAENQPCTNCCLNNSPCRPHKRKRKSYSISPSPQRDDEATAHPTAPRTAPPRRPTYPGSSRTRTESVASVSADPDLGASRLVGRPATPPPQSLPPNATALETPTAEQSYVGRSEYLSSQVPFTEDTSAAKDAGPRQDALSDLDMRILTLRRAFDLPPRPARESLIDAFMERCHPWMPIVERHWLEDRGDPCGPPPSLLLRQAVFLAGSRVLASPLVHTASSAFYDRAKALFFHGHEPNTTLALVAVSLLQWWNPTGPETFSTNTSGFWVRTGAELAYQVGLHKASDEGRFRGFRRRLWWTLVTRDSIISVGTGRPRTIHLADSNMKPLTLADFAAPDTRARLFIAYVSICRHMGDIAEAQRRQSLTPSRQQQLEDGLFRWLKELPRDLRIARRTTGAHGGGGGSWTTMPYNLEARQLAVPYFISLLLLHRSASPQAPSSTVCLMASSFVVSILEEFLSRDHVSCLGPVFTFYALAAGLTQLVGFRYRSRRAVAEHEFGVVKMALQELGKRWGSAHGALSGLLRAKEAIIQQPPLEGEPPRLASDQVVFFSDFGAELCRTWDVGFGRTASEAGSGPRIMDPLGRHDGQWDYDAAGLAASARVPLAACPPALGDGSEGRVFGAVAEDDVSLFADPLATTDGFWLFQNFEYPDYFG